MNVQKTVPESNQFSQETLLAVVRAVAGRTKGREDDKHPLPPGPWDPVIRKALELGTPFGPHPEPWLGSSEVANLISAFAASLRPEIFDALKPHTLIERLGLNPQPLPPRQAFLTSLTQIVTDRAELIAEIGDAGGGQGEQHGIIIVSGYLARFADDFCATGFKPRWPLPNPPPPWFVKELDGVDLLLIAAQLDQAATEAFSQALRQGLTDASAKFAKTGLSRME
jgi:hypothetical protein